MSGEFYMKFVKPKDADPDPILLEAFNVSRGEATISFDTWWCVYFNVNR